MQEAFLYTAIIIMGAGLLALSSWVFDLRKNIAKKEKDVLKEKAEVWRRLYEISILKEIGERTGYSLNVEEILQIITGSLRQFIDYSAVSYIVVYPEKFKLNMHFEQSVDNGFKEEVRSRMLAALSALLDKEVAVEKVEEVISGAIFVDDFPKKVESFFNIPLVIGGKLSGLLTVSHSKPGLYKEEDMTILYKITNQASMAVTRLQEVVAMEQGRLNAMVESMDDGVLMVDREYRVMVANPSAKKIISFNPPAGGNQDITIFDFVDFLGGKFDIHGKLEKTLSQGESCLSDRIEIAGLYFEIGVCPVKHQVAKGEESTFGAVVVFHNITKDVELERVREDFTSMIVHELRSPLDGMKKIIELVVSGAIKKSSPKFKEYIGMLHENSASMLELVNDILDYSKLRAGKFEINEREASVKEVVEDRVEFYKALANTKNIKLSSFVDGDLASKRMVFDDHAVKQVINNFVSNSLKFTPEKGEVKILAFIFHPEEVLAEKISKEIKSLPAPISAGDIKADKKSVVVAVSDSGIGIKEENIGELFATYKQLSSGSFYSETKGTGLGLAIAKGIAESHGGAVGLVSKENHGSSFFFTMPVKE